jgi:serine/threonine protein kinase
VIAAGQSIGNYRILNKIGTGGMGAVYLAEHPLIGKKVALKVIHRELAGNRDVVSRFFQEARAVNQIGNEHIVEIHDFGVTPDGDHFFIMEYLEGRTLSSILSREGKVDVMRSLHIGAQIASALAAAHAAGIIHRDLKPDNIMLMERLGERAFVKVLDFGLAKVFSAADAAAVRTAAGVLLGTPQYMSPEACESKGEIDHRSDIYALGVLLFQMMTGALPFNGASMSEILVKQVAALPPAPRGINPAIPPSVEQILLRCLAKRADARFATMLDLREALLDPEGYLRGSPPIAPARSVARAESQAEPRATGSIALETWPGTSDRSPTRSPTRSQTAPTIIADPGDPAIGRRVGGQGMALAQPQEPKMNTMQIATPLGYSSRPPRRVGLAIGILVVLLGIGGGIVVTQRVRSGGADPAAGSSGAALAAATGTGAAIAASKGSGATAAALGGAAAGAASKGSGATAAALGGAAAGAPGSEPRTMGGARSSVAPGSATRAGTAPDPASAAIGSAGPTTGTAGAAAGPASAATGTAGAGTGTVGAGSATGPGSARVGEAVAAGPGAGSAAVRAGSARLSIDSVPPGALVSGPQGDPLGRTPLRVAWPVSERPVKFTLALAGYKRKHSQTVVNGNTSLHIDLEPVAAVRRSDRSAADPASPVPPDAGAESTSGLMTPDD